MVCWIFKVLENMLLDFEPCMLDFQHCWILRCWILKMYMLDFENVHVGFCVLR